MDRLLKKINSTAGVTERSKSTWPPAISLRVGISVNIELVQEFICRDEGGLRTYKNPHEIERQHSMTFVCSAHCKTRSSLGSSFQCFLQCITMSDRATEWFWVISFKYSNRVFAEGGS